MSTRHTLALRPHPQTPGSPITELGADLRQRPDGALHLHFELRGAIDRILVPAPLPPAAADGLWAHTCCEAFVGVAGSSTYREFNFSPSGRWAIYDFDAYRVRASAVVPLPPPALTLERRGDVLALDATLAPTALPDGAVLQIGLATVVEAADGTLSYWALHHPGARPDFHHRDAFTLTLVRP
ncbi:hypothetical protein GPA22_13535 [Aromatoleum toluvorans]|uniref:DOMON-like domain-containing protein n=1 Tax=Aromatoleum toluvorans TaxID=92002 RepID=A0ABX1Q1H3_9RHOO|nr:DOMON-like domain-containing protein [Aromatoleum toluvorans]NMG44745.1 hypothetical protein [Aromatoleum toluvorans]